MNKSSESLPGARGICMDQGPVCSPGPPCCRWAAPGPAWLTQRSRRRTTLCWREVLRSAPPPAPAAPTSWGGGPHCCWWSRRGRLHPHRQRERHECFLWGWRAATPVSCEKAERLCGRLAVAQSVGCHVACACLLDFADPHFFHVHTSNCWEHNASHEVNIEFWTRTNEGDGLYSKDHSSLQYMNQTWTWSNLV